MGFPSHTKLMLAAGAIALAACDEMDGIGVSTDAVQANATDTPTLVQESAGVDATLDPVPIPSGTADGVNRTADPVILQ